MFGSSGGKFNLSDLKAEVNKANIESLKSDAFRFKAKAGPALSAAPNFSFAEEVFDQFDSIDVSSESSSGLLQMIDVFLTSTFDQLKSEIIPKIRLTTTEKVADIPSSSPSSVTNINKDVSSGESKPSLLAVENDLGVTFTLTQGTLDGSATANIGDAAVVGDNEAAEQQPVTEMDIVDDAELSPFLSKIRLSINNKISEFLDERLTSDRHSLLSLRRKGREQIFVAREASELFRRSQDALSKHRQSESIRIVLNEAELKFLTETGLLNEKIERLEYNNRILSSKLERKTSEAAQYEETLLKTQIELKGAKKMVKQNYIIIKHTRQLVYYYYYYYSFNNHNFIFF